MNNQKYWIWLSRLNKELTFSLNILLEKYKNPKVLWEMDKIELSKNNIKKEHIEEIANNKYKEDLEKYIEYLLKNNIKIININEKIYPQKLKNIYAPPIVIYLKGNEKILSNPSLSIIGCRNCSIYGKQVTRYFARQISKKGINIVSGLAKGIDANAHIGALEQNGKTVAVVGTRIRYNISYGK